VKKEILASLMSNHPWRQVVSINSWAKMSSAARKSRQDVAYAFIQFIAGFLKNVRSETT